MNVNKTDPRIDDLRRRQSVYTRKFAIAKSRRDAWLHLLRGMKMVEDAYQPDGKLPTDLLNEFFEVAKFANQRYGELVDYMTSLNIDLEDVNAKIRASQEE